MWCVEIIIIIIIKTCLIVLKIGKFTAEVRNYDYIYV